MHHTAPVLGLWSVCAPLDGRLVGPDADGELEPTGIQLGHICM